MEVGEPVDPVVKALSVSGEGAHDDENGADPGNEESHDHDDESGQLHGHSAANFRSQVRTTVRTVALCDAGGRCQALSVEILWTTC